MGCDIHMRAEVLIPSQYVFAKAKLPGKRDAAERIHRLIEAYPGIAKKHYGKDVPDWPTFAEACAIYDAMVKGNRTMADVFEATYPNTVVVTSGVLDDENPGQQAARALGLTREDFEEIAKA